jgi:hypothetical protein
LRRALRNDAALPSRRGLRSFAPVTAALVASLGCNLAPN